MLVRPVMKRLYCLKAKNGLGRFAPSALPHYYTTTEEHYIVRIIEGSVIELCERPLGKCNGARSAKDITLSISCWLYSTNH